jgi:homocysteine S-methyltransferase
MSSIQHLQQRLAHKEIIIMDGAMGTEITQAGIATTLPLWSAEALSTHPEVVQKIHENYLRAGAEIIITNTFRTTRHTFAKLERATQAQVATLWACQLARQAVEQVKPAYQVYIAGSMAPLEDCYSPELTPDEVVLQREHLALAQDLKAGGVDFLLLETMITLRETLAAMQAAHAVGLPFAVSFCTNEQGQLLGGDSLSEVIPVVEQHEPLFVGVNCVAPTLATRTFRLLRDLTSLPLSAYAQGDGGPDPKEGWQFGTEHILEHYLQHAYEWLQAGAQVIGGCCGTGPQYVEGLKRLVS